MEARSSSSETTSSDSHNHPQRPPHHIKNLTQVLLQRNLHHRNLTFPSHQQANLTMIHPPHKPLPNRTLTRTHLQRPPHHFLNLTQALLERDAHHRNLTFAQHQHANLTMIHPPHKPLPIRNLTRVNLQRPPHHFLNLTQALLQRDAHHRNLTFAQHQHANLTMIHPPHKPLPNRTMTRTHLQRPPHHFLNLTQALLERDAHHRNLTFAQHQHANLTMIHPPHKPLPNRTLTRTHLQRPPHHFLNLTQALLERDAHHRNLTFAPHQRVNLTRAHLAHRPLPMPHLPHRNLTFPHINHMERHRFRQGLPPSRRYSPNYTYAPHWFTQPWLVSIYNHTVGNNTDKNLVFSPFALNRLLFLLGCGSIGETAQVIGQAIQVPMRGLKYRITKLFPTHLAAWQNNTRIQMAIDIFVSQNYQIKNQYQAIATTKFFSPIQTINFADPVAAAIAINKRVANQTNITNFIGTNVLTQDTEMVLASAINLSEQWLHPFLPSNTKTMPFYRNSCNNTEAVPVQMMYQRASFVETFINPLNASALRLDFAGPKSDVSMYIILPTQCINSLDNLEDTFQSFIPTAVERRMHGYKNVTLMLPKFSIENVINFRPILSQMGMENIFSNDANFDDAYIKANRRQELHVSNVIQKVSIDINEFGIGKVQPPKGMPSTGLSKGEPKVTFNANRPFYFMITKLTQVIYAGRYVGPNNVQKM